MLGACAVATVVRSESAAVRMGLPLAGLDMTHTKVPRCYSAEEQTAMAQRLIDEGWACYPPDSGVAELVEAAKVYAAGLANPRPWEIGSPVACLDRLEQAARKVAKESNNVPRD